MADSGHTFTQQPQATQRLPSTTARRLILTALIETSSWIGYIYYTGKIFFYCDEITYKLGERKARLTALEKRTSPERQKLTIRAVSTLSMLFFVLNYLQTRFQSKLTFFRHNVGQRASDPVTGPIRVERQVRLVPNN